MLLMLVKKHLSELFVFTSCNDNLINIRLINYKFFMPNNENGSSTCKETPNTNHRGKFDDGYVTILSFEMYQKASIITKLMELIGF